MLSPPQAQECLLLPMGNLNYWGYSNERVDELFQEVRSRETLDKEVRKKMYSEINQI